MNRFDIYEQRYGPLLSVNPLCRVIDLICPDHYGFPQGGSHYLFEFELRPVVIGVISPSITLLPVRVQKDNVG